MVDDIINKVKKQLLAMEQDQQKTYTLPPKVAKAIANIGSDRAFVEGVKNLQVGGTHYKDMPIQPSEFIVKNNLDWYCGNAVKYICRHKMKGGRQDLEKAIHYLQLAIQDFYDKEKT